LSVSLLRFSCAASSNDGYWLSNPRLHRCLRCRQPAASNSAIELTHPVKLTETTAMLAGGKVDPARAKALAFANKSLAADMVTDPLLALACEDTRVQRCGWARLCCAGTAGTTRKFEASSQGATLFARVLGQAAHPWIVGGAV
jgi:acyl-homoserine-lactone acylase